MGLTIERTRQNERPLSRVVEIPVSLISPNPSQPRVLFDAASLWELAESIRLHGIIQPLCVRRVDKGYELVAGERRLRAAILAELEKVPCIVADMGEKRSAVLALVENLMRRDLGFFEEAEGIQRLIVTYGITQQQAARMLSKKQSTVANKLRLLRYEADERAKLLAFGLSERHARAILRLQDKQSRIDAIEKVAKELLNVASTEKLVDNMLAQKKSAQSTRHVTPVVKDIRIFSNTLKHALETMERAGITVSSKQNQTDTYIEYVIRISK